MSLFTPLSAPSIANQASSLDPNGLIGSDAPDPNTATPPFSQTLENAFGKVNDLQINADSLQKSFALGQTSDIHNVMIATEQATLALQLTTQVRNKVIDAYQQVMQMSM